MTPQVADERRAGLNPTFAVLLTWFLPGAGHLYLGRIGIALLGFAIVGGLYFLGVHFSNGMTFEYLDPELRSMVAPLLAPEVGNLGGFLWQFRRFGFGPGIPRLWPEAMVLGSYLCAVSGILNTCLMMHAHVAARATSAQASVAHRPALNAGLTWLVPGLGQWRQGRKRRAIAWFLALVGLFVLGTILAEGSNLSRERHFYYWSGQFLIGAPAMIAEALFGGMRVRGDIPYVDCGLVFGCVAGLLNVLAMIDAFAWSEARVFGWPVKTSALAPVAGSGATQAQDRPPAVRAPTS